MNFNYEDRIHENENFIPNIEEENKSEETKELIEKTDVESSRPQIEINGKKYFMRIIKNGEEVQLSKEQNEEISHLVKQMVPTPLAKKGFNKILLTEKSISNENNQFISKTDNLAFKKLKEIVSNSSKEMIKENILEKEHHISKGSSLKTSKKMLAFGAFVLLSPTYFFVSSLYAGLNKGRELLKISKNSLANKSQEMKQTEEKNKCDSMKSVIINHLNCGSIGEAKVNEITEGLVEKLKDGKGIISTKVERHLLRALARQGVPLTPETKQAIKTLAHQIDINKDIGQQLKALSTGELGKALSTISSGQLKKIEDAIKKETKALESPEDSAKQLEKDLEEMISVLQNPGNKNDSVVNREFTAKLRQALKSDAYQALKEDPNNPTVKLLHNLSSGIWNDVKSLDAYKEMGKSINKEGEISNKESSGEEISNNLKGLHKKISKKLYTDHGLVNKISYAITHPEQFMGSMASEGGIPREIVRYMGKDVYDSHGQLSNNPSIQGTTTIKSDDSTLTVQNCYGGSPTIGDDEISPEFHALIQAAENNQFSDNPLDTVPSMIYYTNLQNLDKAEGEGPRSRTIMRLNQEYPLSFFGMTLSKDSSLYMMKDLRKSTDPINQEEVKEFGTTLLNNLKEGVGKPANGFYFHGNSKEWDPVFNKIIENANGYFAQDHVLEGKTKYQIQGAYQEYVYSMLQSYWEMKLGEVLKQRGLKDSTLTTISACKENIDRGGMDNMKKGYLRLPKDHADRDALLTGMTYGRALSARDRVILGKRMDQVLSLLGTIEPEAFLAEQEKLLSSFGMKIDQYQYTAAV